VSIIAMLYRGWGILCLMIPAFLLFLWNRVEIIEGAEFVIYSITELFSRWLPLIVLFPESHKYTDEPVVFLAAAGIVLILLLSYAICLRRSVLYTILFTAPFIFLTFVITDLQSETIYLVGIAAVYLTLLISSSFCPDDFYKRGMIFLPSLMIAALVMGVGYLIAPYGSYSREAQIAEMGHRVRTIAAQMGRLGQLWQVGGGGAATGFGWLESHDGNTWQFNTDIVSIADSGSLHISNQSLLEIKVSEPGTYYLRGYSMQHFDGRAWRIKDETQTRLNNTISGAIPTSFADIYIVDPIYPPRLDIARSMPAFIADLNRELFSGTAPQLVEITIDRAGDETSGITYQPYYGLAFSEEADMQSPEYFYYVESTVLELAQALDDVDIHQDDRFTIIFGPSDIIEPDPVTIRGSRIVVEVIDQVDFSEVLQEVITSRNEIIDLVGTFVYTSFSNIYPIDELANYAEQLQTIGTFVEVDTGTAQALRALAREAGINLSADRATIVDAVAKYVKSTGSYTLTPQRIPEDEDFAVYFLQNEPGGYCIHYATVAVLMLRALDIPARFTSGYVVSIPQGFQDIGVTLTDWNAHAWVEVFYEDIGWLYIEVTPPGEYSYVPEMMPHTPMYTGGEYEAQTYAYVPDDYDEMGPYDDPHDMNGAPQSGAGTAAATQASWQPPAWVVNIGTVLIIIVSTVVILPIRRLTAIKIREKHFKQENTNKAVICVWRYVLRMSQSESVPPSDIEELALKARFSQHQLTEEERGAMIRFAKKLAFEIYMGKGDYGRIWFKYVKALY